MKEEYIIRLPDKKTGKRRRVNVLIETPKPLTWVMNIKADPSSSEKEMFVVYSN